MSESLTTVLIPWDGRNEEWLTDAMNSLPNGTPVVVAKNNGKLEMAHALNAALEGITTEYTFVMGADDLAGPGMLELLEASIGDADGVYPRMELFGDREWTFRPPIWSKHILQHRNTCGVFLVRTSILKAVGGWRDSVIEDWDLVNRIAKDGGRFERVERAEYRYRQHSNSLSQRINRVADDEQFSGEEQMKEILGDKLHRYPLEAVFFGQASAAQNYVRGQVPAELLPGVATDLIWEHNFGADTSIWLYPGQLSYEQAFNTKLTDLFSVRILDSDDNYLSPRMLRSFERAGRKELARFWKGDVEWHARFARNADAVFVSTPSLAESYAASNDHVYVLRNSVLEADWRRVRKPEEDGKVRIGWAAGRQHDPDADIVNAALRSVARRWKNVEVVVVGVQPKWDFDYVCKPFTPSLATYRQELATFDISIAPLKLTDMNHGKSDLKWLEASMAGAAFVCTDYEPYATVQHGYSGMKCKDRTEWEECLEHLVRDADHRRVLVENAQHEIRLFRTAEIAADEYRAAITETRDRVGVGAAA